MVQVIHEGWLIKSPSKHFVFWKTNWTRRYFVLSSTNPPGHCFLQCFYDSEKAKLRKHINLNECEQVDAYLTYTSRNSKVKYDWIFDIRLHKNKRVYYFAAQSEDEMNEWVSLLCRTCRLKKEEEEDHVTTPAENSDWLRTTEDTVEDEDDLSACHSLTVTINHSDPVILPDSALQTPRTASPKLSTVFSLKSGGQINATRAKGYMPLSDCVSGPLRPSKRRAMPTATPGSSTSADHYTSASRWSPLSLSPCCPPEPFDAGKLLVGEDDAPPPYPPPPLPNIGGTLADVTQTKIVHDSEKSLTIHHHSDQSNDSAMSLPSLPAAANAFSGIIESPLWSGICSVNNTSSGGTNIFHGGGTDFKLDSDSTSLSASPPPPVLDYRTSVGNRSQLSIPKISTTTSGVVQNRSPSTLLRGEQTHTALNRLVPAPPRPRKKTSTLPLPYGNFSMSEPGGRKDGSPDANTLSPSPQYRELIGIEDSKRHQEPIIMNSAGCVDICPGASAYAADNGNKAAVPKDQIVSLRETKLANHFPYDVIKTADDASKTTESSARGEPEITGLTCSVISNESRTTAIDTTSYSLVRSPPLAVLQPSDSYQNLSAPCSSDQPPLVDRSLKPARLRHRSATNSASSDGAAAAVKQSSPFLPNRLPKRQVAPRRRKATERPPPHLPSTSATVDGIMNDLETVTPPMIDLSRKQSFTRRRETSQNTAPALETRMRRIPNPVPIVETSVSNPQLEYSEMDAAFLTSHQESKSITIGTSKHNYADPEVNKTPSALDKLAYVLISEDKTKALQKTKREQDRIYKSGGTLDRPATFSAKLNR